MPKTDRSAFTIHVCPKCGWWDLMLMAVVLVAVIVLGMAGVR